MTKGGVYENIRNEANIINEATDNLGAGAIFGVNHWFPATVKNCMNAGDIKVKGVASGICPRPLVGNHDAAKSSTFVGCINTGDVESIASYAGGIIGAGRHVNTVEKCVNAGKVTATTAKQEAGGIVGYYYSNGQALVVNNCVNVGAITCSSSNGFASGIIGQYGDATISSKLTFKNNVNVGTLSGATHYSLLHTDKQINFTSEGNYYLNTYEATNDDATTSGMTGFTADQLESGEITYMINTDILGSTMLYQAIGFDKAPCLDSSRGTVVYNEATDTYRNINCSFSIGDVAAGYTPTGTAISSAEEFAGMTATGTYYLAEDITLTASYANTFTGTFDGNGHTITLTGYAAFNATAGAIIKNLKLTGTVTNYDANKRMGAVTNTSNGVDGKVSTFENIFTEADIENTSETSIHAGGIYGYHSSKPVSLKNCMNAGNIKVTGWAGGIAGSSNEGGSGTTITGCINTGKVESTTSYAAGIVSRCRYTSSLESCINTGAITAKGDQAAGIVGYYWAGDGAGNLTITKCVNVGSITNAAASGARLAVGILGNYGAKYSSTLNNNTSKLYMTYNVNVGNLSGNSRRGIANINYADQIFNECTENYYLAGVDATNHAEVVGMESLAADKIASGEITYMINNEILVKTMFYQAIGFDDVPVLDSTHGEVVYKNGEYVNDGPVGAAITSAAEFAAMDANGLYYLANNITLTGNNLYYNGCFKGVLDGNGKTVTLGGYAAFSSTTDAVIKNLNLTGSVTTAVDATITNGSGVSKTYSNYLGAVTQASGGGTFENIVNNANVTGTVADTKGAGLIGLNDGVINIINCTNNGNIKVTAEAAGIISWLEVDTASALASVVGCINNGSVESTAAYAGGIVGRGRHKNLVEACINTGKVTAGASQAAGIVAFHWGQNAALTITKCVNIGDIVNFETDGTNLTCGILGNAGGTYNNNFTFTYNINAGTLDSGNRNGLLNTADATISFTSAGNYYLVGVRDTNNKTVTEGMTAVSATTLASGQVAYALNDAIGSNVFYQTLGADNVPMLDSTDHKTVYLINGVYTNNNSKFAQVNVTLGSDIKVKYYIHNEGFSATPSITFTMNGKSVTVEGTLKDNYYEFVFEGVAPQCIGDTIIAELRDGDNVVETKNDYSVLTYLTKLKTMTKESWGYSKAKYDLMLTLIDNLLVYGGAAQGYTNHNADSLVSKDVPNQKSYTISGTDKSATNGTKVTWKSGNVRFDNVNKIIIKFEAADLSGVTFKVKINDGQEAAITEDQISEVAENTYTIITDAIYATGFDDVYTITAYYNGTLDASVTYSIKSYANSMQNDEEIGALAVATYSYGRAAIDFIDQKSTEYLSNTYYNLTQGDKTLNIVYLGGSVTSGQGATDPETESWRALTTAWLKEQYPEATITAVNAAIGGTGSYLADFRYDTDVKVHNPDLLFVDFAINDYYTNQSYEDVVRTSETLIRKAYEANPYIDIVYVLTFDSVVGEADFEQLRAHRDVAQKYDIPVIKLSTSFYSMLEDKNKPGATIETSGEGEDAKYSNNFDYYFTDWVHPNATGYAFYADVITEFLGKDLGKYEGDVTLNAKELPEQQMSELPLMTNAHLVLSNEIDMTGANGWAYQASNFSYKGMTYGGRIYTNTVGSTFTFTFTGTDIGLLYGLGTNMGKITCAVDGGEAIVIDAKGSQNPKEKPIGWNLENGTHTVVITFTEGTAFEIGAILVN